MAVNETKVIGRAFRKLIDEVNNKWYKFSFWTAASDVEFSDGKTAEEKFNELSQSTEKKISDLIENKLDGIVLKKLTKNQYNSLKTKDNNTMYIIVE